MAREPMESLDTKQQGLLLALLLFGSRETDTLLSHLNDDLAAPIKKLANERLVLDRNARIQVAATGLERLFSQEKQSRLQVIDPSWLSDLWEGEDPVLVKLISPVLQQNPMLLHIVERCFAPMPLENIGPILKLSNLIRLSSSDLIILAQHLGQLFLATAFSQLGMQHTIVFLRHYGSAIQDAMLERIKNQPSGDFMNVDTAKLMLSTVFARFADIDALLERAGLFALSETLQGLSPELLKPFAQRLHKNQGRLILDFATQIASNPLSSTDLNKRRHTILSLVIELSQNKSIEELFSQCTISESIS